MKASKTEKIKQELMQFLHSQNLTEKQIDRIAFLFQEGTRAAVQDSSDAVKNLLHSIKTRL
mgnify:FL=1